MKQRAVFFDRDGVLNDAVIRDGKPYPPQALEEVRIQNDVPTALQLLKQNGFILIGATNQPDVSRGTTRRETVEAINQKLLLDLPLQEIYVCFHDDHDHCDCRKPKSGLLKQAAKQYDIDLKQSFMIGDRWKDIAAGQDAGCKTIWLNYHYQEAFKTSPPDYITTNLLAAAEWIIHC